MPLERLLPDFYQGRRVASSEKAYALFCIAQILEIGREEVVSDMQREIDEVNGLTRHVLAEPAPSMRVDDFTSEASSISSASSVSYTRKLSRRRDADDRKALIQRRRSARLASISAKRDLPPAGHTPIARKAKFRRSPPPPMPILEFQRDVTSDYAASKPTSVATNTML